MFGVRRLKLDFYDTLWSWEPENMKGDYTILKNKWYSPLNEDDTQYQIQFGPEMILGDGSCSLFVSKMSIMDSKSLGAK